MKLDYYDLISPVPFVLPGIGSIRPPTLRDIARLTNRVYATYLALLNITPEKYCTEINVHLKDWYQSLTEEQLSCLTMYDIAVSCEHLQQSFSSILDFFFLERIVYDSEKDAFISVLPASKGKEDTAEAVGIINKSNYLHICSLILQFNHIVTKETVNPDKVKNKKGLARYMEMQAKRKKQRQIKPKADSDLDLGNIISAVCTKHNSIHYINVWDMTVYQLWDTFARLRNHDIYESGRTSVSVWGDKENKFDFNLWYKNNN